MFFKKSKPAEAANPAPVTSEATPVAPSENVSLSEISHAKEKEIATVSPDSRSISSSDSKRKVETTGLDEAKALDRVDEEEEIVYPTGAKLAFITFALCLSVFLMALVCTATSGFGMRRQTDPELGQHHNCNSHTAHNRCI